MSDVAEIVKSWLEHWSKRQEKKEAPAEIRKRSRELDELIEDQPAVAWEAVRMLVDQVASDALLAVVAAGPLEDLLCRQGPLVISQIEEEAGTNPKFRKCLRGVWGRNRMDSAIAERVEKACGDEAGW